MPTRHVSSGYLFIDNGGEAAPGPGGTPIKNVFEADTRTCSHCHRVFVLNPVRQRTRAYCPKCDNYVCDQCEVVRVANGGECIPLQRVFDRVQEVASRGGDAQAAIAALRRDLA